MSHACKGLHLSTKEVSEFIISNDNFNLECNKNLIAGYQTILIGLNDSTNKKNWAKWKDGRMYIDHFVSTLNLWESFCKRDEYSFLKVTMAIKHCKTFLETATAIGMSEEEFHSTVYQDEKLVQWLLQNGYQI